MLATCPPLNRLIGPELIFNCTHPRKSSKNQNHWTTCIITSCTLELCQIMTLTNSLTKPSLQPSYLSGFSPFPFGWKQPFWHQVKIQNQRDARCNCCNLKPGLRKHHPVITWCKMVISYYWYQMPLNEAGKRFCVHLSMLKRISGFPKGAWNMLYIGWYLHQHLPYSQPYSATFKTKKLQENLLRIHPQQTIFF